MDGQKRKIVIFVDHYQEDLENQEDPQKLRGPSNNPLAQVGYKVYKKY